MPVMDGVEFGRQLRLLHPAIPILYISARDPHPDLADPIPDGSVLRKPFRTEVFIETLLEAA